MKRLLILGAVMPWLFPALSQAKEPVAVIVIGDVDEAAELQTALEKRLVTAGYELLSEQELLQALPGTNVAPDERLERAFEDSLKKATEKYANADIGGVRAQLEVMEALLKEFPAAGAFARDFFVLQAAMFLDDGNENEARASARRALDYGLEITPDPEVFRPAVGQLIDAQRDLFTAAEYTIVDVPAGATILLNGSEVDATFQAAPSLEGETIRIEVRAPKYRSRVLEVAALSADKATISMRLPYETDEDVNAAIHAALKAKQDMDSLAETVAQAAAVVVVAKSKRVAVARPGNGQAMSGTVAELDDWFLPAVKSAQRRTGTFLPGDTVPLGWRYYGDVSLGWLSRSQAIHPAGNKPSNEGIVSSGPYLRVAADLRKRTTRGDIFVDLQAEYKLAPVGRTTFTERWTGDTWVVRGGGSGVIARGAAGFEYILIPQLTSFGGLVLVTEVNFGQAGQAADVQQLGVNTPFTRFGFGARVGFGIRATRLLSLELAGERMELHLAAETGDVKLGNRIGKLKETRIWLAGRWALPRGLDARLELSASSMLISFDGAGNALIQTFDAQRDIGDLGVLGSIRKTF